MIQQNQSSKLEKNIIIDEKTFSRKKKLIFTGITFIFLFFILICVEFGLRMADYDENLELFISTPSESSLHYGINLKVAQRYFYYYGDSFDPTPRKDLFLKEKPENGFRIFVLGASTTAGFPYGNNISFPRFLQQRLADAYPDRYIEVINTAITSVNTYTLLDFMDEILQKEPDLILVYAGHNEFFGPFGPVSGVSFGKYPWLVRTVLTLQRYKTFILLRNIFGPMVRKYNNEISFDPVHGATQKISDQFIENTKIEFGSEKFQDGLDQFENNFIGIIEKAKDTNVPIILSELVCNVRDQAPFPAGQLSEQDSAMQYYKKGRQLERQGKYDEARIAYYKAKDFDPVRFRAPEEFNMIIHDLSEKYDVPYVPMKSYFNQVSSHGLIGNNIILEHVHPNIKGYFLMSEAFYKTINQNNIFDHPPYIVPEEVITGYLKNWGITKLDTLAAQLAIMNLTSGWPFTTETFSTKLAKESIIKRFPVNTIVDSFALKTYVDPNYSVQSAHYDLAQYYEAIGELDKAITEYHALICCIPTVDMFYERISLLLWNTGQYLRAKKLLINALNYTQSAVIYKNLGRSCIALNQYRKAILYLEKACYHDPDDKHIIFSMIHTYYNMIEFKKADSLLTEYESSASLDDIMKLKDYRRFIQNRIGQVEKLFKLAKNNFDKKQYKKAISALQESVQYLETSVTNELMGVIMLRNNQYGSAISYFERARNLSLKDNPHLLSNLMVAYAENGQAYEFDNIKKELKESFPDFKAPEYLNKFFSDNKLDRNMK